MLYLLHADFFFILNGNFSESEVDLALPFPIWFPLILNRNLNEHEAKIVLAIFAVIAFDR